MKKTAPGAAVRGIGRHLLLITERISRYDDRERSGFPPSGKIGESQGKIFPYGKSGNFNVFVESQVKSGNFDLA